MPSRIQVQMRNYTGIICVIQNITAINWMITMQRARKIEQESYILYGREWSIADLKASDTVRELVRTF